MIFGGPETQHGELPPHRMTFFCLAEKKSEFTTENSFCEFGIVFLPKKMSYGGGKVRRVGFQVHQNHPNRPA